MPLAIVSVLVSSRDEMCSFPIVCFPEEVLIVFNYLYNRILCVHSLCVLNS